MIILECDVCKTRFQCRGIFTNVINQIKVGGQKEIQGFEELIPAIKTDKVQDVCVNCMDKLKTKQRGLAKVRTNGVGVFYALKCYVERGLSD